MHATHFKGPMAFLREKMRSGDDIRRAQILSFAYDSHSINRSAYHTTIIMLGETGVGKVRLLTHLLPSYFKMSPYSVFDHKPSLRHERCRNVGDQVGDAGDDRIRPHRRQSRDGSQGLVSW